MITGLNFPRTGNSWFPSRPYVGLQAEHLPLSAGFFNHIKTTMKVVACAVIAFIICRALLSILRSDLVRLRPYPPPPRFQSSPESDPHRGSQSRRIRPREEASPQQDPSPILIEPSEGLEGHECTICLEKFNVGGSIYIHEAMPNDKTAKKIQHFFHESCWNKVRNGNGKAACCLCREDGSPLKKQTYILKTPVPAAPAIVPESIHPFRFPDELDCSVNSEESKERDWSTNDPARRQLFFLLEPHINLMFGSWELIKKVYPKNLLIIFETAKLNLTEKEIAHLMFIRFSHPDSFTCPERQGESSSSEPSTEEEFTPYIKPSDVRSFVQDCLDRDTYITNNPYLDPSIGHLGDID